MKKKNILLIILVFIIILLLTIIAFNLLDPKKEKIPELESEAPAVLPQFKTSDEAINQIQQIDKETGYNFKFKEETDKYWVIEKINTQTNEVECEYFVGKENGIINTSYPVKVSE